MNLLVVDDDPAVSVLLSAIFLRYGFAVETVADGEAAVQRLRSRRYSVILLDLMLPKMNGFEVIREVRSFAPMLLNRVVVVTAASEMTLRHFDAAQVFSLLRKPFDLYELVATVRRCAVPSSEEMPRLPLGASVPMLRARG
jgi:DNA-binding response OmpR family regulator